MHLYIDEFIGCTTNMNRFLCISKFNPFFLHSNVGIWEQSLAYNYSIADAKGYNTVQNQTSMWGAFGLEGALFWVNFILGIICLNVHKYGLCGCIYQ